MTALPRAAAAPGSLVGWTGAACVVLALVACAPDRAAYDAAVARMEALDRQVDADFDRARALHVELFAKEAWDDPDALAARIGEAQEHIARAIEDHDRRVAAEEAVLDMDLLKDAVGTRLLYRMDLEAQRAKGEVFAETRAMYDDLAGAVLARDPKAYARAAEAHGVRIAAANDRYRELDLARQRRQEPPQGP